MTTELNDQQKKIIVDIMKNWPKALDSKELLRQLDSLAIKILNTVSK
jgi:hypothetical protein